MKLDRNINKDGSGKYALLNLRTNKIQWGDVFDEDEFFVIKLKDVSAKPALEAYAHHAETYDKEWAGEVRSLAERSGSQNKFCKQPD